MSDSSQAETVNPPNPLEKAKNGDGPVSLDPNVLKRAEESVEKLAEDYSSFAQADVDGIKAAIARAEQNPAERSVALADIYTRALDLKGQGGGFGYNKITSIGDLLTKFLEGKEDLSSREFEIVHAHVDAMQAVLREEMKGGGDKIGVQIVDGLAQLVQKA